MTLTQLNEPHLYGYTAQVGNRRIELIRAYAGEWLLFRYVDGKPARNGQLECKPQAMSWAGVRKVGVRWLKGEVTQ